MTQISHDAFYLGFGAYGITVFPNQVETFSRADVAASMNIDEHAAAKLQLLDLSTDAASGEQSKTAVGIYKATSKVSHMLMHSQPDLHYSLARAIKLQLKGGDKIVIDPGVTAVLAHTQWGKTTFTSRDLVPSLSKSDADIAIQYISFIEPFEGLSFGENPVIHSWCAEHKEFFRKLAEFMISDRQVCIVDSIRPFIYDQSVGGTAAGGMDAYLPIQLTALSNLAAQKGKHIVMLVNPMMPMNTEDDRAKFADLQKRIESSIPNVFTGTGQRMMSINLRGPSHPDSKVITYSVPTFQFDSGEVKPKKSRYPDGVSMISQPVEQQNIVAGIVGSL